MVDFAPGIIANKKKCSGQSVPGKSTSVVLVRQSNTDMLLFLSSPNAQTSRNKMKNEEIWNTILFQAGIY